MNPATASLYLADIIHHHLACGVIFLIAGHLYRTQFGIGLSLSQLLAAHKTQAITSWHFQLSINLAILGTGSILAGHILTAIPSYAYLRFGRIYLRYRIALTLTFGARPNYTLTATTGFGCINHSLR